MTIMIDYTDDENNSTFKALRNIYLLYANHCSIFIVHFKVLRHKSDVLSSVRFATETAVCSRPSQNLLANLKAS